MILGPNVAASTATVLLGLLFSCCIVTQCAPGSVLEDEAIGLTPTLTPQADDAAKEPPPAPTEQSVGVGVDWMQHEDPLGFVVQHPIGWTVVTEATGFILIRSADNEALVVIQAFLLDEPLAAREWVTQVPSLYSSLFPQARLQDTHSLSKQPDEVVASMTYELRGEAGQANLLCSIHGRSGMLYVIAAPRTQFESEKDTLVAVLRTFSFTYPSRSVQQPGAGPRIEYIDWQDPKEAAFSLEVPSGWDVRGGMFRFASVDTRPSVEVTSPDDRIRIIVGDADMPPFALSNPYLDSLGFPEGSWYSPGYGVAMMVSEYLSGEEFAQEYVRLRIAGECSKLRFTETRDLPELVKEINAAYAQFGTMIATSVSAGEVAFTCQLDEQPMLGYYCAGTQLTISEGFGVWSMQFLDGYFVPAASAGIAQSVLAHMVETFRFNPNWVAQQQQVVAETSRIVARTNEEISSIINDSYWARQETLDDVARHWSNTILGQTDLVDPQTGETWKVASGQNYYWRQEHTDTIAGSDTYERPDIDFTPLQEW